jgi:hypothetical protein
VGAPYFILRDDLRRLAPLWLRYTRAVRNDSEVGRLRWWGGLAACARASE